MTVINFNDLSRGTVVDNEYTSNGVTISAVGGSNQAMIFDTANPTGGDSDLATSNLGKVLIISEDGDGTDPDDNANGGTLRFTFSGATQVQSLTFLDIEEGATVRFYNEQGQLIKTQQIACTYNNGQRVVSFDTTGVYRMDVQLCGSGAVDNLVFNTPSTLDGYVDGTSGNDVIDANFVDHNGDRIDANDQILPGEGVNDDIVRAGAGNDLVLAGNGNDEVYGGDGNDTLCGQDGNDTLFGENGNDILEGMNGNDLLYGGAGVDTIYGDAGNDTAFGGSGDDKVFGGTGDDSLYGGAGNDSIAGGDGNDVICGDDDAGAPVGREDNLTLQWNEVASSGTNLGASQTYAVGGMNVSVGFQAQDQGAIGTIETTPMYVEGGEPFDPNSGLYLYGLGGEGGIDNTSTTTLTFASNDVAYANSVQDVSFRINDIDYSCTNDSHRDIVTVRAYDASGNLIPVTISAESSQQHINGNTVTAGVDANGVTPNSQSGSVLYYIAGPVARIEIDYDNSAYTDQRIDVTDINFTTVASDAVEGVAGNDVISGGNGDDLIYGKGGNDTITGDAGNDTIYGGDGDDKAEGGTGNDSIDGGNGNDFLLGGDGADVIAGGAGNDTLCGQDGNDTLYGGAGNDILEGMNDNDVLFGGAGNDRVYGDAGNDVANGGDGNDTLYGGTGNDTLSGDAGNDAIYGGADRDVILGGAGDTVDGGSTGNDWDILDLTGQGAYILTGPNGTGSPIPDSNGNGFDGRVVFVDADGNPTGQIINYTEIEEVRGSLFNQGPDANDDSYTAGEDGPAGIVGNVIGNDTDPNGDTLTVSEVNGAPANVGTAVAGSHGGLVTINPDGTVSFDPNGEFEALGNGDTATTTVTYTVTDPDGAESTATVTITVTGSNDGPTAVADTFDAGEDGVTALGNVVAANDTDPEGDTLTVSAVNGAAGNVGTPVAGDNGGLITINADGTASFDANGEFEALGEGETTTTEVTYTITDPDGATSSTTVTITVTGVNDGPVAVDSAYTVSASEAAGDVDGNAITDDTGAGVDSDPEGDTLTVVAVDGATGNVGGAVAGSAGGLFTINADGSIDFDANGEFEALGEGETATTTVSYTIADEAGLESTANVTFTVTGTNDGPVAVEDSFTVGEDDPSAIVGNVLGNDTDPDGDTLTVSEVNGNPANVGTPVPATGGGLVTINADGSISFDPNGEFEALAPGETADVTVTYTATDPSGAESTTTVTITVNGVNDGPDATDNAYTVSLTEAAGDVDGNVITDNTGNGVDSDPENDTLTVVAVGGLAAGVGTAVAGSDGGLFTINADGTVDFDANGDFDGLGLNNTATTSVTYTIVDAYGAQDTATVTFTVTGINNGTVEGTLGNDIIGPGYVDADGDLVDGNDAILPGDTGNDDLIYGYGGDDSINAGDGNDEVYGGEGNDVINGGDGDDWVSGGTGNDVINGGAGNDTLNGNQGNDTINGGDGNDVVNGGLGDDSIEGGAGNDVLNGEDGDDTIGGGTGDDMINGGAGNDVLSGGAGNDKIEGSEGEDSITGGSGNDDIWGGLDNDTIDAGSGDDTVGGGAGDDSIIAGSGNDTVEGGDGNDVIDTANHVNPALDYDYPSLPFGDNDPFPNNDLDTVYGGAGDDIIYTGDDADSIDGGAGNDFIDAGIDNDSVTGGDGDDTIIGGQGEDIIEGNDGNDLIYGGLDNEVLNEPDATDEAPDDNRDTIYGGAGNDTIYGRDDADTLYGDTGNDLIYGGVDDDSISGGEGNDTLYGDEGDDSITGNAGIDTIYGGTGNDFVGGGIGDFGDEVHGDEGDDFVQGGAGDDTLFGGSGDDKIDGDGGDDTIYGDEGNDSIQAGIGDDTLFGGDGDDVIRGNIGADIIEGNDGDDYIYGGSGSGQINDDIDPDPTDDMDTIYGGNGNDVIQSGDDADVIYGGDGDDRIYGGIDNDTITGGAGEDTLFGGYGSDTFYGGNAGDNVVGGEDPDDSDVDILDLTGSNVDFITYTDGDPESGVVTFLDGSTMTFSEIENVIPCFTPGTTIATAKGERLVEELQVGDRIITRDNGIQEIAWVGHKAMTGKQLVQNPHLKPILIKAGALGNGLPERDMMVSPNHRVLVASELTQLYFEENEVLAAAKHMVGGKGIHAVDVMSTTYVHFMFERHEVVLSNGAWTESFQPGDYSLKGIGNSQRNEIMEIFPELATKTGLEGYQSARKALKKHEAKLLIK